MERARSNTRSGGASMGVTTSTRAIVTRDHTQFRADSFEIGTQSCVGCPRIPDRERVAKDRQHRPVLGPTGGLLRTVDLLVRMRPPRPGWDVYRLPMRIAVFCLLAGCASSPWRAPLHR